MKDNGRMISWMGLGKLLIRMGAIMKENGVKVKRMEKVFILILRRNGNIINSLDQDKEFSELF
jgi:hypothetical protein